MAHHNYDLFLEATDRIEATERRTGAGCALRLGPCLAHLSPAQEAELLAQLIGRARGVTLISAFDGARIPVAIDPEGAFDTDTGKSTAFPTRKNGGGDVA